MAQLSIEKYLRRNQEMKARKAPWDIHFQRIAEAFLTRKQNFTTTISPGDFLYDDVFDNTGEYALFQAASVYVSMLWPDSSRSVRINPVEELKGLPGVEEFFRFANRQMYRFMDRPEAGLLIAVQEFEIDMQAFGTAGIGVFEKDDDAIPVSYEAWGVKNMTISENAQGFVDLLHYPESRTIRQIVEEYGIDNVHPNVAKAFNEGKLEDKKEVLQILEPRSLSDRNGVMGRLGMPVRTLHIDVENKFIMREGGFEEFPVMVGRMVKTTGEEYGRSPAMTALPDASSLNALKEAIMIASEKQLDPPLYLMDDGRLGGGVVDTSAGALNIFNSSGRLTGDKPVGPLFTVGEMQSAEKLEEAFKASIMQAFGLDRLLDLNNQTQMTAYETSVRDRMRGQALGSMFARRNMEVFTPLVQRTFNILYRRGLLGDTQTGVLASARRAWAKILGKPVQVVPPAIRAAINAGLDVYEVEFISPATRFMQSEKLQGIYETTEYVTKIAAVPGMEAVADLFNLEEAAEKVIKYSGAPCELLRTKSEVDAIRKGRAQAQQQMAQIEAMKGASEIARNAGQAKMAFTGGGGGGAE